jgi:hypothetical protein
MDRDKVTAAFHEAMLDIYRAANEIGYRPGLFLRMVNDRGGLAAARQLINDRKPSDGFTRLWQLKRLDLSVEAVALREPWNQLFTPEELTRARERLISYEFDPDKAGSS